MAKSLIPTSNVGIVIIVNKSVILLLTNLQTVLTSLVIPQNQFVQTVKNAIFVDYKTKLTKVCLSLNNH